MARGAGVIIGVGALVTVIALVAAILVFRKPSGADADAGTIALPGSGTATVISDAPSDAGTAGEPGPGAADAGAKSVVVQTPTTAKVPAIDPKADAACAKAAGLAAGGNVTLAVNAYRTCDGPGKVTARVAIDQAAIRAAAKGCGGMRDAQAAASIGASSALTQLKAKKCK
jgi:hypothetical protein